MISLKEMINVAERERFTEIGFPLKTDSIKPIFLSFENKDNKEFRCMLDSGASIPVWCAGIKSFKLTFPKAESQEKIKYILGGFGRGFEVADVYYVPAMMINNGEHSIVFNRTYLPVVNKNRFGADLILPSSFFRNANIVISQMQSLPEKKLILQCRSLWYVMKFTKIRVNAAAVKKLKEEHGITGISAGEDILGVEGEFNDALAQLCSSVKIIEDGSEQDSLATPLDVFEKNFEN